jgi:Methyltransferase domain
MSRHPLDTNIFGIDVFSFDHQREEAEQYRQHLQGNGFIHWSKSDSILAIPELQSWLNGAEIDILFIDGDHTLEGVKSDYRQRCDRRDELDQPNDH